MKKIMIFMLTFILLLQTYCVLADGEESNASNETKEVLDVSDESEDETNEYSLENITESNISEESETNKDRSEDVIYIDNTEQKKDIINTSLIGVLGFEYASVNGERKSLNGAEFCEIDEKYYIPIRMFCSYIGAECEWHEASRGVYISYGDYVFQFFDGKPEYFINGIEAAAKDNAALIDGSFFLTEDSISEIFNKKIFTDNKLIIICDKEIEFEPNKRYTLEYVFAKDLVFERPDKDTIYNDLIENTGKNVHPRLMLTPQKLEKINQYKETDDRYKRWINGIITSANGILTTPLSQYISSDTYANQGTMLVVARTLKSRFKTLSAAYLLTEDEQYLNRAWQEIENLNNFPDWGPAHFLATAEISAGVAVCYDWMYNGFTEQQRAIIRNMAKVKAFNEAIIAYRGTGPQYPSTKYGWVNYGNNWNVVCNSGIGMLALSMAEEPDVTDPALECIESGIKNNETILSLFYPEGSYSEGMTYWQYTIQYLTMHLLSLDTALGTCYGLLESPGLAETMYFPLYLEGPVSQFSFGDGTDTKVDVPEWSFYAEKNNDVGLLKRRAEKNASSGGLSDLIYFNPELESDDGNDDMPLDRCFGGIAQIAVMRDSWNSSETLFMATRAGLGSVNHGHQDMGSFIIEAYGKKWVKDYGSGNYYLPGYFGSNRYDYFMTRAEGHNMLIINPEFSAEGYNMSTVTDIDLKSKKRGAYLTLDFSETCKKTGINSYTRAMGLIDERTRFIVQDEVETDKESEYYWFMNAVGDIEILEDKKAVILTQDNKKMLVQLITDKGEFSIMAAEPLPESPQYDGQILPGEDRLAIHVENTKDLDICVVMTPFMAGQEIPYYTDGYKKIADWEIQDGEMPKLQQITADGRELDGFNPQKSVYLINYDEPQPNAPKIEAVSELYDIKVTQADAVPGYATIDMIQDGQILKTYTVQFNVKEQIGKVVGKTKYKPVSADASDVPEAINTPQNTIDDDLNTKWAAEGQQYLLYDLGEKKKVDTVSVAWYDRTNRITNIKVYVSNDAVSWEEVYSGQSRRLDADFENYSFDETEAQFVKVEVYRDGWNSVLEVGIHGTE